MTTLTDDDRRALQDLRSRGFAVCVFTPDEMPDSKPHKVEDAMCEGGWGRINSDNEEASDENAVPMCSVRVADLSGVALDWAVAKCENPEWSDWDAIVNVTTFNDYDGTICNYSTDWSQAGPIITRESISLTNFDDYPKWTARYPANPYSYTGHDPLQAAMRCYVAGKMGSSVNVPEELVSSKEASES